MAPSIPSPFISPGHLSGILQLSLTQDGAFAIAEREKQIFRSVVTLPSRVSLTGALFLGVTPGTHVLLLADMIKPALI